MKAVSMKAAAAQLLLLLTLATCTWAHATSMSPVSKTLSLLSDLQAKIVAQGEKAQKLYSEFSEGCEDTSKQLGYEIKTGKATVASLQATIESETATVSSLSEKSGELAAAIATDEADLAAATKIREKEAADFTAEEKELSEIIDTLQRAIGILKREMRSGGVSMEQLKTTGSVAQALNAMVQASVLSSADAGRLTALVQSSQQAQEDDEDASLGAPAAAIYTSQSGGIVETLEDLLEKAEAQLAGSRKKETAELQNFELLKQSLEDEIKFGKQDLAQAEKSMTQSGQTKSTAEADLSMTSKELSVDSASLADLHSNCLTKAEDFEAQVKSRGEELRALAEAKKVISETSTGAEQITYGFRQVSLLQRSSVRLSSDMDLARYEAVRYVRDLARKENSTSLAQLASRMASAMDFSSETGGDPFAKVKGLIRDMITRLTEEGSADASHKEYCDKELSETHTKKDDLEAIVEKLSANIDTRSTHSAKLKEHVATLSQELDELAARQAEMDKDRKAENDLYLANKADLEKGLEGVKLALKILREYYSKSDKAHDAGEGAGGTIIGLLEVVESDFSKGLAEATAIESTAAAAYEKMTKDNEIEKTTKDQDVKYKTKESGDLDKAVAELSSDRAGEQTQLDAVLEYLEKMKKLCIAKPETYEARTKHREAEIAGLKDALEILESEATLLQRGVKRRALRGINLHTNLAQ